MKQILTALALVAMVGSAQAQHHGHGGFRPHHHMHGGGWGWVVPAVIGGTIVYAATRPAQAQPPIVVQPVPQSQSQSQVITCPPGTMPFEQNGWVRNQYGQWIQSNYIECK